MAIKIQIDRLVLEDMNLSPRQRRQLQTAVEVELSHLIQDQGIPARWQQGGKIPILPSMVKHSLTTTPMLIGQEIARSIYGRMQE